MLLPLWHFSGIHSVERHDPKLVMMWHPSAMMVYLLPSRYVPPMHVGRTHDETMEVETFCQLLCVFLERRSFFSHLYILNMLYVDMKRGAWIRWLFSVLLIRRNAGITMQSAAMCQGIHMLTEGVFFLLNCYFMICVSCLTICLFLCSLIPIHQNRRGVSTPP